MLSSTMIRILSRSSRRRRSTSQIVVCGRGSGSGGSDAFFRTTTTSSYSTVKNEDTTTTTTTIRNNKKKKKRIVPRIVFLNAGRLDYDHQLDFSRLHSLCSSNRTTSSSSNDDDDGNNGNTTTTTTTNNNTNEEEEEEGLLYLNDVNDIPNVNDIVDIVHEYNPDVIMLKEMMLPSEALLRFPPNSVKLICEAGTGYNNIPIELARQHGIVVCNVPTYSTNAVAHMAITYILNFSVSMLQQQDMLRCYNDRRNFIGPFTLPLNELDDQILGLIGGSGRIGTRVAQIALSLGIKHIIMSSRADTLPINHILYNHPQVTCTTDIDNVLLPQCDYVSIHTPLNKQTRNTFGKEQIMNMKSTAYLINTSRGGILNEIEFIECMKKNIIAGAGLDVTTTEPPTVSSEIWNLKNVYLTPHTGWRRKQTRQRLIDMVANNIEAYCYAINEQDYINVVN